MIAPLRELALRVKDLWIPARFVEPAAADLTVDGKRLTGFGS